MHVGTPRRQAYHFGPFRIEVGERLLRRDGAVVPLTPKAVDTLIALVEGRGRLIEKNELMNRLWPGTFVEEANLTNQISVLRKALGDDSAEPRYIETMPRRGYRFVADVLASDGVAEEPSQPAVSQPARRTSIAVLGVVAVLVATVTVGVWWRSRNDPAQPAPLKITRLTTSGQVRHASISPDGKYVVYVALEGGGQSLQIRQVSAVSRVELVPTADVNYVGVTFSPDANFIYYVVRERGRPREGALYKVSTLGGPSPPRRLLTDIDSPVAFSPDGSRIAYVVSRQINGWSALMVANADGSAAYPLCTRTMPDEFTWVAAGPAWVPAGDSILSAGASTDGQGRYSSVIEVQIADGSQKPLGTRRWTEVGRIGWLADGRGFIMAASERLGANQLWHVSYPRGDARRITNDESKNYLGVSLTADSSLLATVQRDGQASLWSAAEGDARRARQITIGKYDGRYGLTWTPDGRIAYHSMESGNDDIWIMNADGTGRRQLTAHAGVDEQPSVTPDGRHVVFASARTGTSQIWRADVDGGNEKQLTRGHGVDPVVTPDGLWVVYTSSTTARPTLWKVPLDGGVAAQLTSVTSMQPTIAPDGKLVAFRYLDDPNTNGKLAVLRFADGEIVKVFDSPPEGPADGKLQWTGRGITYVKTSAGVSNIWSQPLTGGPPQRLTHFGSDRIVQYDWSRDGRFLIYARGTLNNDVVLVSNMMGQY